jgi:hypothetical protein
MKLTRKRRLACFSLALALLFLLPFNLRAQHFAPPAYTPHFGPVFHPGQFNSNYGTVSMQHKFRIVFLDGTDTTVQAIIHADTPSYYLLLENKSVRKKDSARFRKIYPTQTKYIVRLDRYNVSRDIHESIESTGMTTDSCWLFKDFDGKICAYTPLAEDDVDDGFIRYIQKDKGPLIEITKESLATMVDSDEKATGFAEKGKYSKAIKHYNHNNKSQD